MRQMSALGFCFLSEPPVKSLCSSTALCNLTPLMTRRRCPGRHQPESLHRGAGTASVLSFSLLCRWPAGQTESSRVPRTAAPRTSLSLRPPSTGPAPAQCAAPRVVARRTPVPKPNHWPLRRAGASAGAAARAGGERGDHSYGVVTLGRRRWGGRERAAEQPRNRR